MGNNNSHHTNIANNGNNANNNRNRNRNTNDDDPPAFSTITDKYETYEELQTAL
jgi:hypothetical protein